MTRIEQHKMIQELKEFASAMSREDLGILEMLSKRDKDDEDLDSRAISSLERLHQQYVRKASKKDVDAIWKKLTEPKKRSDQS